MGCPHPKVPLPPFNLPAARKTNNLHWPALNFLTLHPNPLVDLPPHSTAHVSHHVCFPRILDSLDSHLHLPTHDSRQGSWVCGGRFLPLSTTPRPHNPCARSASSASVSTQASQVDKPTRRAHSSPQNTWWALDSSQALRVTIPCSWLAGPTRLEAGSGCSACKAASSWPLRARLVGSDAFTWLPRALQLGSTALAAVTTAARPRRVPNPHQLCDRYRHQSSRPRPRHLAPRSTNTGIYSVPSCCSSWNDGSGALRCCVVLATACDQLPAPISRPSTTPPSNFTSGARRCAVVRDHGGGARGAEVRLDDDRMKQSCIKSFKERHVLFLAG